jgi:anti-anti-sigma factor
MPPTLPDIVEAEVRSGTQAVILDLTEVYWVSSTMLGILVGCFSRAKGGKANMVIVTSSRRVMDALHVIKLDSVLQVRRTVQEALECLSGGRKKK